MIDVRMDMHMDMYMDMRVQVSILYVCMDIQLHSSYQVQV